jgi:ankyrin repeat protein
MNQFYCPSIIIKGASILIEAGADVNFKSTVGQTSLMLCSMKGDSDTALILIKAGCIIDSIDSNGDSALHFSTRFNKKNVETILLSNGADRTIKNLNNQTPYDYQAAEITNLSYE